MNVSCSTGSSTCWTGDNGATGIDAGNDLATRDRLLGTAARLFADNGFATVSVRDICRDAGANVAAVNYHFTSKDTLFRDVLQRRAAVV